MACAAGQLCHRLAKRFNPMLTADYTDDTDMKNQCHPCNPRSKYQRACRVWNCPELLWLPCWVYKRKGASRPPLRPRGNLQPMAEAEAVGAKIIVEPGPSVKDGIGDFRNAGARQIASGWAADSH